MSVLQIGNPQKLNLLARFAAVPVYEKVLHKMFKDSQIRGEWYTPTQDLIDIIDMVRNKNVMPLLGMLVRMQKIYGIRNGLINRHRKGYTCSHQKNLRERDKKLIDRYIDSVLDS